MTENDRWLRVAEETARKLEASQIEAERQRKLVDSASRFALISIAVVGISAFFLGNCRGYNSGSQDGVAWSVDYWNSYNDCLSRNRVNTPPNHQDDLGYACASSALSTAGAKPVQFEWFSRHFP